MATVGPIYKTGTVTIENGETQVTFGGGALPTVNIRPGDIIIAGDGTGVIESVSEDNVTAILAQAWQGAAQSGASYVVTHTGSSWHTTVTINEQLAWIVKRFAEGLPFTPKEVGTLANLSQFDDRPKNFSYLAADQTPAQWFVKLSDTSGDWSDGIDFVGPEGEDGDPGATLRFGSGAPTGGLGNIGDGYIDYAAGSGSGDLYEKTGETTWTLRTNIKGPMGDVTPEAEAARDDAEDARDAAEGFAITASGAAGSAATSATTATTKAAEADASADAALSSENAASASALSASGSATTATNKAAEASGHADDAATSAVEADQAATDAETARDTAEGFADIARSAHAALQFNDSTADSDPGAGKIRANHATLSSATRLFIDLETMDGADITSWLDSFDDSTNTGNRGEITLCDVADVANWVKFRISDANESPTGYRRINVTFIAGGGTIANDAILGMKFARTGDKGLDGVGVGDVTGDTSSTTNRVATFADTSGKIIKDSGILISELALTASLGSAAYQPSSAFATAAQGAKADTAIQSADLAAVATSNDYDDLDNLPTLGTAAALNTGTGAGEIPILQGDGKLSTGILPEAVLGSVNYKGGWNATTNTPTIPAAATGNKGWYYIVETAGNSMINGIDTWGIGDWIISDGTQWTKIDAIDAVSSVAGLVGVVTDTALRAALNIENGADVTDETNVRAAIAALAANLIQNRLTQYKVGTVDTQTIIEQYGWLDQYRMALVLEADGSLAFYSYSSDGSTIKRPLAMSANGVITALESVVAPAAFLNTMYLKDAGLDHQWQIVIGTNNDANYTMTWGMPNGSVEASWPSGAFTIAKQSDVALKSNKTRTFRTVTASTDTLVLADAGEVVKFNSASAITCTIPTNAAVAFPIGTQIDLMNINAGDVSITPASGVTLLSDGDKRKITGQYVGATLIKDATNTWYLMGTIAA